MRYLILMTFSGSILFAGYWCWARLFKNRITQRGRYIAIITVLLVYLIPWVWLRGVYKRIFEFFRRAETVGEELSVSYAQIESQTGTVYRTRDYQCLLLIAGLWFLGALILLFVKVKQYYDSRRELFCVSVKSRDSTLLECVEKLQREQGCRCRIEVYETVEKKRTFTVGIIRPVIFLQNQYTDRELEWILKHEIVHIARNDMITGIFLEAVCCLHWFNPLIYVLKQHFETVCENSCDERVLRDCNMEERVEYARLIAKNMADNKKTNKKKGVFQRALADNYDKAEERVKEIMSKRMMRGWEKVVAGSVFAIMLLVNSMTAFAYPEVYHMEEPTEETSEIMVDGDIFVAFDEGAFDFDFSAETVLYDEQFIDEAGNIYPVISENARVICLKHNVVSGYLQSHVKDDNGGCTIRIYECTRCTICNTIWIGDLVSTHIYVTCPH